MNLDIILIMISKYFNSFIQYSKRHFEENKKTILINIGVFLSLIISLILIDQLTKEFLFKGGMKEGKLQVDPNDKVIDFGLFGIRSVVNEGVTFLKNIPTTILHIFSVFVFIICIILAIYSHDKLLIIAIAFTFAGTFGNFLDRAMFKGSVRDILYIPWLQSYHFFKGVFNFADIWLLTGSIIAIVYLILLSYRHYKYNKI